MNDARTAIFSLALTVALAFSATAADREPGIRLRVFAIGKPIATHDRLADGQSANADVTLAEFSLAADAAPLAEVGKQYITEFTAILTISEAGTYRWLIDSPARFDLRIDGREPEVTRRSKAQTELTINLLRGTHSLRLMQFVNKGPSPLAVQWQPPGSETWQAVPKSQLSCAKFVFRPTQPGNKRLAAVGDRPGKRQPVGGLYPSINLLTLHDPKVGVPVGGIDLLPEGRLAVAVFEARRLKAPFPQPDADGELWLYSGVEGDGSQVDRELIAENLFEPSGVCCVGDSIYVSQRSEVTRFDFDEASQKWKPTTVASGFETTDFHALSFGLIHEPGESDHPGFLYMARGTGLGTGENPPLHGAVLRIDLAKPVGDNIEPISGGHRTPNGIAFGPGGDVFVTDNQGEWTPCNELNHVEPGNFYGFFHRLKPRSFATPFQPDGPEPRADGVTEAAVWLPQDEIGNSPSEPILIPEELPFAGQMLVGDVKYGGINRISLERVDGTWQGAAYRFTQGLEGGVNRIVFGRDGSLYVGGIGGDHSSTWNWINPQGQKTYQGLQRLRFTDRTVFDIELVEATPTGLRLTFTKPVAREWLTVTGNYKLRQWTYLATGKYGGAKVNEQELRAKSATPADDGRSVELAIDGLRENYLVYLLTEPKSTDGESLWSTEAWYTLRKRPIGNVE